MKKVLYSFATLGALTTSAFAQSSVTMFGLIDMGPRLVKNGDGPTLKSLTRDGLQTSYLGFRGEEDLGGALKAGFFIQSRIVPDTGVAGSTAATPNASGAVQQSKFFDLRATVSLSSQYGELRLGRDYAPSFSNLAAFDPYGAISVGPGNLLGTAGFNQTSTLGSAAGTLLRVDNTVAYRLPPKLGGLYGTVMAAAGEGVNNTNANNRYVGARMGWEQGPLNIAGAFGRTRIPGHEDFQVWNVGAAYQLPFARLMALYHRAEWRPTGLADRRQDYWSVAATVPVLGTGMVRAAYGSMDMRSTGTAVGFRDQDDARSLAVGYIHNLSKRTALYADWAKIENRGLQQLSFLGGTSAGSGFGTRSNLSSTTLSTGIRHSF